MFIFFAILLYCDNWSVIQIAHNDVFHEQTKLSEINCHFICHHLVHFALKLLLVSSQDQLTDIFPKSHPKKCLHVLVYKLKLVAHLSLRGLLTCTKFVGFRPTLLVLFSTHTCTTHILLLHTLTSYIKVFLHILLLEKYRLIW